MAAYKCFVYDTVDESDILACFTDSTVITPCCKNEGDTLRRFACDVENRWPSAWTALNALAAGKVRIYDDTSMAWRTTESWVEISPF